MGYRDRVPSHVSGGMSHWDGVPSHISEQDVPPVLKVPIEMPWKLEQSLS